MGLQSTTGTKTDGGVGGWPCTNKSIEEGGSISIGSNQETQDCVYAWRWRSKPVVKAREAGSGPRSRVSQGKGVRARVYYISSFITNIPMSNKKQKFSVLKSIFSQKKKNRLTC